MIDAGLCQLLHESSVFAAGSVQKILAGKEFDRALCALKLVDEALVARFLSHFNTCYENVLSFIIHKLLDFNFKKPQSYYKQF